MYLGGGAWGYVWGILLSIGVGVLLFDIVTSRIRAVPFIQ